MGTGQKTQTTHPSISMLADQLVSGVKHFTRGFTGNEWGKKEGKVSREWLTLELLSSRKSIGGGNLYHSGVSIFKCLRDLFSVKTTRNYLRSKE